MESSELLKIVLTIALLIISLGIHEAAHGWMALKCGDTTARDMGRITLDPLAHIDPMMTVVLPAIMYMTLGVAFGGAKPVPVNFRNLRHGHRDMALVALAGPVSNLLLAIFFKALIMILAGGTDPIWGVETLGIIVLWNAVYFNLLLMVFNLMPIPPLDGSRIMTFLLPAGELRHRYQSLERFGMLIIFALVMIPGISPFGYLFQAIEFLNTLITPLVSWLA